MRTNMRTILLAVAQMRPVELGEFIKTFSSDISIESLAKLVDSVNLVTVYLEPITYDVHIPRHIQAIKFIRDVSGMGLKEAKDLADRCRDQRIKMLISTGIAKDIADDFLRHASAQNVTLSYTLE